MGISNTDEHLHLGQLHWTIIRGAFLLSKAHAWDPLFCQRFREETRAGDGGWQVNGVESHDKGGKCRVKKERAGLEQTHVGYEEELVLLREA